MTVVAVVNRNRGGAVLLEAMQQAETYGADIHVVYVLQLGILSSIEIGIADRIGIPGVATMERMCRNVAKEIADPLLDEYEAVGLVGEPGRAISTYAKRVNASCVVVDGQARWNLDLYGAFRDPIRTIKNTKIPVVEVN